MAVPTGRYRLGTKSGRIVLRTYRDGLAATAGHDLIIDLPSWSGELAVDDDKAPEALEVRIDIGALSVRDGTGGLKPLSDRDRSEIATTHAACCPPNSTRRRYSPRPGSTSVVRAGSSRGTCP